MPLPLSNATIRTPSGSVILRTIAELTADYLSRMFQKALGVGPKQYLLRTRMNMAKSLLQDASLPIKVIACSVGYNDQLHFSRAFKQYFDLPPTEWRKRYPPNSDCLSLTLPTPQSGFCHQRFNRGDKCGH
ncbi:helix-turn-helix transcriptional regulator (plasmid) [Pseudomonas silvicola]|nr:helix-turn-helix transcriptional regulator [Pseudomonas silvicola]